MPVRANLRVLLLFSLLKLVVRFFDLSFADQVLLDLLYFLGISRIISLAVLRHTFPFVGAIWEIFRANRETFPHPFRFSMFISRLSVGIISFQSHFAEETGEMT